MSMNTVNLMGRLVRDPDVREIGKDAKVCNFTLAVDRNFTDADGNREADFVSCVAWRGTADFLGRFFHKGDPLALTGRIQTRKYDDDDGETHYVTEIVADQLFFCGSRREASEDKPADDRRDKYGFKGKKTTGRK